MIINSVLIAGAGAIGLVVAETLYNADPRCVSILARGERLERYRKKGLTVNGRRLDFRFGDEKPVDLIIVASKFYHLDQIIQDLGPYVGKDTRILSLLNGISSEDIIGRAYGRERIPLAMIIGTDAFHSGEETRYHQRGIINFGNAEGKNGERENSIADFFTRTGIPFVLQPDMKRLLWYKYMINVGVNQTTAALRLPYGAIQNQGGPGEIGEARLLAEKAMKEVILIANAEGIDLNGGDINQWYKTVNTLDPSGYTSMAQDVLAGRKTEVEMFGLAMMELGKKHRIPVPVNETLYLQLRTIEQTYPPAGGAQT
ncbi:MAG: 2-dehydropantoate 2-reductase [Spirochaetaceae bacterium]|nr:2-dehydropantoate 2-reductase [Spirochaetaceae bacterium]